MIPSALIAELRQGLADYLLASFWSNTPGFESMIERLVDEPQALMRGPYLSLKLPFKRGPVGPSFFEQVPMGWPPHAHQERAFARLGAETPKNTLVATGTGSGKTESFLIPILAECIKRQSQPGIKAILIYPMNALATDQARRLAQLIHDTPGLKGRINAGLFVGQREKSPKTSMSRESIITDRDVMVQQPPDILLTNYKMLDYLLMRPRYQRLWKDNASQTLRFLVVDEIHTFDGAQGTDLACLIRRLKRRLDCEPGALCCVGTSATLGGADDSALLLDYAQQVFGEPFEAGAIVTEERISAAEFLEGHFPSYLSYPLEDEHLETLRPGSHEDERAFLSAQSRLWLGRPLDFDDPQWPVELGHELKRHIFSQQLLTLMQARVISIEELGAELRSRLPAFRALGDERLEAIILSFVALISAAKREVDETAQQRAEREAQARPRLRQPLIQVAVQLWQRELARMVASVEAQPCLRFSADLQGPQLHRHLPALYCPDCGLMGWASKTSADRRADLRVELDDFYSSFFGHDPRVQFLFPAAVLPQERQRFKVDIEHLLCRELAPGEPVLDGEIEVVIPENTRAVGERRELSRDCSRCGAHEALTLIGYRAATLTSTMINQLYASRFNDDKKLLTFSDSVQDAAHRAGFFGARTWAINVRAALQQVLLQAVSESSDGTVPISELSKRFARRWTQELGREGFVATFLPKELETHLDYLKLVESDKLPAGSALPDLIRRRIDWQVYEEYGLRVRIGRTLTRSSSSAAFVDPARLEAASAKALEPLTQLGGLRQIDAQRLRLFMMGLCRHLLERGAIFQPELPEEYLKSGGKNTFIINQRAHLPNFGKRSRLPVFWSESSRTDRFESLGQQGARGWYRRWFDRFWFQDTLVQDVHRDAYAIIIDALKGVGVLRAYMASVGELWGLEPQALLVSAQVEQLQCDTCKAELGIAMSERDHWLGSSCLESSCQGHYIKTDASRRALRTDYYRQLYARGDIKRVIATEHTGLLGRDERQDVETRFKTPSSPRWYPNLLSCTPTLEMGIDIGDLSTAILCSVPPTQANYLQRVGRAGRRDGNALLLTLAGTKPHDLFFFAEPEEMLAGAVRPPGVYLDASAVLERQLVAYCVDRWVFEGATERELPPTLERVLGAIERTDSGQFPHNLLTFIEVNQTKLLDDFLSMFDEQKTTERAREHLRRFMFGDSETKGLRWKILQGLTERQQEYKNLGRQIVNLNSRRRKLEELKVRDDQQDNEIKEIGQELDALRALSKELREAQTLNFFTDEGLLPNYAFPEAGVTLRSLIWRSDKKGEAPEAGHRYKRLSYEYVRPSSSALSELAPNNHFYADGYKVQIDRIDLRLSKIELWRFCDDCDYAAPNHSQLPVKSCPSCGSMSWGGTERLQNMLRLKQVYASTEQYKGRISDDSDERSPAFYNKQMLVTLDEFGGEGGWFVDSDALPFGIEYIRKVSLREINFGERADIGPKLTIAGQASVRQGFKLCIVCGKIQRRKRRNEKYEQQHDYTCRYRDKDKEEAIEPCLYLYRELESEAVRILLPFLEDDTDTQLQSFVSALQLGLKDYFGGNIEHLRATVYSEPLDAQSSRKQFLLLYDTIPGGTGYLKELVRDKDKIFAILRAARDQLKSCACNQVTGKDGCYRCLYAYRSSRDQANISRKEAIDLLNKILPHEHSFKPTKTLGKVQVNALFDSVLEGRFIESLRRIKIGGDRVRVRDEIVFNKVGYTLQVGDQSWLIEPQVELGPEDGVVIRCKPDFVIRPARSQDKRRPIAIFTDGWAYHKDRLADDALKRRAILESGRFWVWSLTWDDIEHILRSKIEAPLLTPIWRGQGGESAFVAAIEAVLGKLGGNGPLLAMAKPLLRASSHNLLLALLSQPEPKFVGAELVRALAGVLIFKQKLNGGALAARLQELEQVLGAGASRHLNHHHAQVGATVRQGALSVDMTSGLQRTLDVSNLRVLCALDDQGYQDQEELLKGSWQDFLGLSNLLQFLPLSASITHASAPRFDGEHELRSHAQRSLEEASEASSSAEDEQTRQAWEEALSYDAEYNDLLHIWRAQGTPAPIVGFEPLDERGHPMGIIELAWTKLKLGLIFEGDEADAFIARGWRLFTLEALRTDPVLKGQLDGLLFDPA